MVYVSFVRKTKDKESIFSAKCQHVPRVGEQVISGGVTWVVCRVITNTEMLHEDGATMITVELRPKSEG